MAFWNTDRIKRECQAQGLITPYREERALRCAYELGVGPEAFITSKEEDTTHLPERSKVTIPPGQFGLLITRETIFVPPNAIAFISIRARIKFQGLVNVSGFHVDPGYRGQLKFAVYNAGSKDIVLDQDERVFMIWYADLDAPSPDPYPALPATQSFITSDDVSRLKGEVASPAELKKQVEETKTELEKKIHAVEQSKLFNRGLLIMLITAVVTLFFTSFIKPYFDGSKDAAKQSVAPPAVNQRPAVQAVDAGKVIALPAHLGFYILGAGGITGASVIAAAFIVRIRSKS
jgi:dCTP deaminase